jgi:hypothetical protein
MNREFEQMQSGGTSEEFVFINVNIVQRVFVVEDMVDRCFRRYFQFSPPIKLTTTI